MIVPSGWNVVPLEQVALGGAKGLADGPFGSAVREADYRPAGVPVLRGGNLGLGNYRCRIDDLVFISDELADKHIRAVARANDVVFTKKGTIGSVGIIPSNTGFERFFISSNQMKATIDPTIADPLFVYYFFAAKSTRERLVRESSATGVPKINLAYLRSFKISLPPLDEQRRIAHILGSLDDKIELNRKMNRTLEEVVVALHDHLIWNHSLAQHWDELPLSALTSYLNRGLSPKYVETGGTMVINQKCVRDGKVDLSKARRHDPVQRRIEGRELRIGDILVNSTGVGTLGRVAQIAAIREPMVVDSHITVVRADPTIVSPWVLGVEMKRRQQEIEALGEGSTGQTELGRARLGRVSLRIPPKAVQVAFDHQVVPLRSRMESNEEQDRTLVDIRDALLPKLVSGELRIPDAEAAVAEVVS